MREKNSTTEPGKMFDAKEQWLRCVTIPATEMKLNYGTFRTGDLSWVQEQRHRVLDRFPADPFAAQRSGRPASSFVQ